VLFPPTAQSVCSLSEISNLKSQIAKKTAFSKVFKAFQSNLFMPNDRNSPSSIPGLELSQIQPNETKFSLFADKVPSTLQPISGIALFTSPFPSSNQIQPNPTK
jgi:hypothetical protein